MDRPRFNPLRFHRDQKGLPPAQRRRRAALLGIDRHEGGAWTTHYDEKLPGEMVDWFRERLERVQDAEWSEPEGGGGRYVPRPLRPPTFAGFAAHLGTSRERLAEWEEKHAEFKAAAQACRAVQEAFMVECGAQGGLNPQVANMILKNLVGWKDKADVELGGKLVLKFDAQDSQA